MQTLTISHQNDEIRQRFFQGIFGTNVGWIAVATKQDEKFSEKFFRYPQDVPQLLDWINATYLNHDLYYSPMLYGKTERKRESVIRCPVVWSEFDSTPTGEVYPLPSVVVESSPNKYHAYWFLGEQLEPPEVEALSRRATYTFGADKGGWALSKLLRIPITHNYKYEDTPQVLVRQFHPELIYAEADFGHLHDKPELISPNGSPTKDLIEGDPLEILTKYGPRIPPLAFNYFNVAPETDHSKALWSLESMLFEVGLEPEEVFVIAWNSAVNKYKRDGRPPEELWVEIGKAQEAVRIRIGEDEPAPVEVGELISPEELKQIGPSTFVERYILWASSKTDAAPEYHQAGAFVILSSLLASAVVLPTSAGNIIPNLWFMLLGDSTLTRKTTSMGMAMKLLNAVNDDILLATDGSIEGLMTELSNRPGRSSVFWRDEFSGMLDAMRRRDYYSGMVETLAKLYDGERQKRILRKETIDVRDPRFIIFAGGIKSRTLELFDASFVVNGFIPRFIFITAEADPNNYRALGPSTPNQDGISAELLQELIEIQNHYNVMNLIQIGDQQIEVPKVRNAHLTEEAWKRYNDLEQHMVMTGYNSDTRETVTPTLDRLCKSTLKAAVLLAASRQREDTVEVELQDILRAISYLETWQKHSLEVVKDAGKNVSEKTIDRAMGLIKRGKQTRSALMNSMHLSSKEATLLLDTLEQRGLITIAKAGKNTRLVPV